MLLVLCHIVLSCVLVLLVGCSEGADEPDDVVRRRQEADFRRCLGNNGHGSVDFELLYTYGELTIEDLRQWYPGEFDDVDEVDFSALRNVPEWAKTSPPVPDQIVNDCLVAIGGSPTLDIDQVVRIEPGLDAEPGDG